VADGGGDDYEIDMMKALRKVNVDNNRVGWYQSTFLGSYCTKDTILHQFEYQESLPNRFVLDSIANSEGTKLPLACFACRAFAPLISSVVLIYDSVRTAQGQLAIKALRLTDQFCDAHRSKRITAEGYVLDYSVICVPPYLIIWCAHTK
jgi:translation initiation factor 3 subunit H